MPLALAVQVQPCRSFFEHWQSQWHTIWGSGNLNNATKLCDDDHLRVLLDGDETSDVFRSTAKHLETCASCQTRLLELAADGDEWSTAKESLSSDEIELERAERSWSTLGHRRAPKTWTESMSTQLLDEPSHPEMLGRIGRYEVERLIGCGGMGVVFKAFDSELNRPVAVKALAPHLAGSGAARKRFAREARASAAIVHEHVVAIHNVESENEPPYLVMPFVAGESLQARIDREGPLGVCEVLRIARQTAAGLAAAHEQGLVHRDVKPSNILLEEGVDRALLTDFGLVRMSDDASLTYSGHVPGTPHYMSPEQARGERADQQSDLFSLGSVMYAMCTGRAPFRAETSYGVLRRITDSQPRRIQEVNPDMPDWLGTIIQCLHAKSPDERFESAAKVSELLAQCLAHLQQPEVQPLPASVAPARSDRLRWPIGLALIAVAILVASLLLNDAWQNHESVRPADVETPIAPGATPNIDPDPATNWDLVEQELDELKQQSDDLSSRIELLWDDEGVVQEESDQ